MQSTFELRRDTRLEILNAAASNRIDEVRLLLKSEPSLINAKTRSAQQSLLHVAASRGHDTLCQELLTKGHPANPVDKNGHTPYQLAKTPKIKQILADAHINPLLEKLSILAVKHVELTVYALPNDSFVAWPFINPDMSPDKFTVTTLSPVVIPETNKHTIITTFRQQALMIPYYGELLLAHEAEQIAFFIQQTAMPRRSRATNMAITKVSAYAQGLHTLLEKHPELIGYPIESDTPAIVHAKKLVIAYGLMGFASYKQQLSATEYQTVSSLPHVAFADEIASQILTPAHQARCSSYRKELDEIYTLEPEIRAHQRSMQTSL